MTHRKIISKKNISTLIVNYLTKLSGLDLHTTSMMDHDEILDVMPNVSKILMWSSVYPLGTVCILYPQVTLNILIVIRTTIERVGWMYLFSFYTLTNLFCGNSMVIPISTYFLVLITE